MSLCLVFIICLPLPSLDSFLSPSFSLLPRRSLTHHQRCAITPDELLSRLEKVLFIKLPNIASRWMKRFKAADSVAVTKAKMMDEGKDKQTADEPDADDADDAEDEKEKSAGGEYDERQRTGDNVDDNSGADEASSEDEASEEEPESGAEHVRSCTQQIWVEPCCRKRERERRELVACYGGIVQASFPPFSSPSPYR